MRWAIPAWLQKRSLVRPEDFRRMSRRDCRKVEPSSPAVPLEVALVSRATATAFVRARLVRSAREARDERISGFMSAMTNRLAYRPCRNAAAPAGARNLQPVDAAFAFARDMVCVRCLADGMTGIGGWSETGSRAFRAGDDT